MSRPLRPATPWRPDWRVLPLAGSTRPAYYIRSSSGQAWVCLRSLLAAVGLTCWRRWQRPARRLASACGHATQPGVDWCARPTLLLPVECVGDMLVALRLWLAVGQPSASTRAARRRSLNQIASRIPLLYNQDNLRIYNDPAPGMRCRTHILNDREVVPWNSLRWCFSAPSCSPVFC